MGFIYVIINKINGKSYVGKTTGTVEKRFSEHIKDSKRKRYENRPLYSAMNKYGVENFMVKSLEYVEDSVNLGERESYWIKKLHTYREG